MTAPASDVRISRDLAVAVIAELDVLRSRVEHDAREYAKPEWQRADAEAARRVVAQRHDEIAHINDLRAQLEQAMWGGAVQ